ncbi:MAG: YbhB/YbcL family Raf kinase inhibitor-like protein [Candidatus Nitrosopelagicus sp.]|nr:YbhB/YbcL family Raf kinase inhibitor-like protein [Candidatus Nitrosopelagicus sp.]
MSEFSISSPNFNEGEEIPKKFGYKHGNETPDTYFNSVPTGTKGVALIMDDPDAMKAVGKVWVHYLMCGGWAEDADYDDRDQMILGKTDFGEIGYGGPAPPDGRHTYVFKGYALDTSLNLEEGYSKQELEDAMKGHIISEAKLTGTFST